MARVRLEDQRDFELTDKQHDLRGRELRDAVGRPLGHIKTMIMDTDAQRVDAVVLDTGAEYAVRDLQIMEQAVYFIPTPTVDTTPTSAPAGDPAYVPYTAPPVSPEPTHVNPAYAAPPPQATVAGTTADPTVAAPAVPPPAPPAVAQAPSDSVLPPPAPPMGAHAPSASLTPAASVPFASTADHSARTVPLAAASPVAAEPPPRAAPAPDAAGYNSAQGGADGVAEYASAHDDDFRDHFAALYDVPGLDYADLAPVYRFGVEAAAERRYLNHDGIADETALRDRFNDRFGYPAADRLAWLGARAAVLHGLGHASRSL